MGASLERRSYIGDLPNFYGGSNITQSDLFSQSTQPHGTILNRIRQVAPTAQERATMTLGRVPTALLYLLTYLLSHFLTNGDVQRRHRRVKYVDLSTFNLNLLTAVVASACKSLLSGQPDRE